MRGLRGAFALVMALGGLSSSCDDDDGDSSSSAGGTSTGTGGAVTGGGGSGGTGGGSGGVLGGAAGAEAGGGKGGGAAGGDGAAGSSASPSPQGVGGSWTLVWNDEFDGANLDFGKWRPNWYGTTDTALTKPVNDLEVSCYDPAQVEVVGGNLELTAVATTKAGCVKKDGTKASYASGLVMTDGRYNFTYGFVEARMWLPPGTGTPENWAAFWVNGKNWPEDGEIDVMETLGGGAATRWTYHYDSDTGAGTVHEQITAPKNNLISGAGWHVFGTHWQSEKITFYYDGQDVGSVASADLAGGAKVTASPHYFIINHGIDGNYAPKVPSTLKVDYVRHWQ